MAGEAALDSYANDQALDNFRRADRATGASRDARKAQALSGIARSQSSSIISVDQYQLAWNTLIEAFDLYVDLGKTDTAAELATESFAFGPLTGTEPLLRRALELVEPGSNLEGWLRARYGIAQMDDTSDFDAAELAHRRAIDVADATGDDRLKARATVHLSQLAHARADYDSCVATGREAVRLTRESDDSSGEARVGYFLADALLAVGLPDEARDVSLSTLDVSERIATGNWVTGAVRSLNQAAIAQGQFELDFHGISSDIGELTSRIVKDLRVGVDILTAPSRAVDTINDALDKAVAAGGPGAYGFLNSTAKAGYLSYMTDDSSLAHRMIETRAHLLLHLHPHERNAFALNIGLAWAAVTISDHQTAGEMLDRLTPYSGRVEPQTTCSVDRVLGSIACLLGAETNAAAHYLSALEFLTNAGYRPELAWTSSDYAEMLLDRDESGDREKAIELQDEALAITQELGMQPLTERILARREILRA
ncbi:MAG: hypothetical protein QF554_09685 [Dehalococcoidia bacterium]|jgi:hypothetical protein|nr:hypothetical protein [Dehalococcoidia bacterium]